MAYEMCVWIYMLREQVRAKAFIKIVLMYPIDPRNNYFSPGDKAVSNNLWLSTNSGADLARHQLPLAAHPPLRHVPRPAGPAHLLGAQQLPETVQKVRFTDYIRHRLRSGVRSVLILLICISKCISHARLQVRHPVWMFFPFLSLVDTFFFFYINPCLSRQVLWNLVQGSK